MAGVSAKPLWNKLGFKPGEPVLLIDAPAGWSISGAPEPISITRESSGGEAGGPAGAVIAFFVALEGMREALPVLGERIFPAGALWAAWPRRAGGHESDIREQGIRELALPLGLVDVKVAALDENWSGLRLVWRVELRGAPHSSRR
jgi:hypothetical protein